MGHLGDSKILSNYRLAQLASIQPAGSHSQHGALFAARGIYRQVFSKTSILAGSDNPGLGICNSREYSALSLAGALLNP